MATTKKPKTITLRLPEVITISLSPETRTVIVGLHSNGDGQRQVVLHEPSMTEFRALQAAARDADDAMPTVEPFEDPNNPTGEELLRAREQAKEQNDYVYGDDLPYGHLFLQIVQACATEEVKLEELPSWATGLDASRRVLDFFKSLSGGLDVLAAVAAASTPRPEA